MSNRPLTDDHPAGGGGGLQRGHVMTRYWQGEFHREPAPAPMIAPDNKPYQLPPMRTIEDAKPLAASTAGSIWNELSLSLSVFWSWIRQMANEYPALHLISIVLVSLFIWFCVIRLTRALVRR